MMDALLQVSGLSINYHKDEERVEAATDLSFAVTAGSVLAVIGASGAGKSSLALALTGLLDRNKVDISGEILFQGSNILSMSESGLNSLRGDKVGMIFQDPRGSLDPTMKVERQVVEAIRQNRNVSAGEAVEEARKRLRLAGIDDELLSKAPYAHQLSSGLCQRVMVAIALAGEPLLLIADEPTGSLDLTWQAQIIGLLQQQIKATGLGVLFITHDLGIAASIADHLLVMQEGRVVEYGLCKDVLAMPRHDYTASMLHAWRDGYSTGEQIASS